MRKFLHVFVGLAAVVILLLPADPAHALLLKSYISGLTGSDANSCGPTDPCFSFQKAHDVTRSGGQIGCLDNATEQGLSLVINKSITIDCGISGSSLYRLGPGSIAISAPGIVVKILNLTIDVLGADPGSLGIYFVSGAELVLENCQIQNFLGIAVKFSPQVPGSQLSIINTTFDNNGTMPSTGGGLQVLPAAGGSAGILLDRVTFSYTVTAMVLI